MESKSDGFLQVFHRCWWRGKSGVADLKLRLALSMESKSDGFPLVFHRCWWLRKFGFAKLKLTLPLSMESKSHGFHWFSIGVGGSEKSESLNLSLGWPSVWTAKVIAFHRFANVFVAQKIRIR